MKVDSIAERLGIRRGDVIVFQDSCCSTLPQVIKSLVFIDQFTTNTVLFICNYIL